MDLVLDNTQNRNSLVSATNGLYSENFHKCLTAPFPAKLQRLLLKNLRPMHTNVRKLSKSAISQASTGQIFPEQNQTANRFHHCPVRSTLMRTDMRHHIRKYLVCISNAPEESLYFHPKTLHCLR